jgi:hypothetical protein
VIGKTSWVRRKPFSRIIKETVKDLTFSIYKLMFTSNPSTEALREKKILVYMFVLEKESDQIKGLTC